MFQRWGNWGSREIKYFGQTHTAGRWQSLTWDPVFLTLNLIWEKSFCVYSNNDHTLPVLWMQSICPGGCFLNCHLAVVNPDKLPKIVLRGEEKGYVVDLTGFFIFLQDDDNVNIFQNLYRLLVSYIFRNNWSHLSISEYSFDIRHWILEFLVLRVELLSSRFRTTFSLFPLH